MANTVITGIAVKLPQGSGHDRLQQDGALVGAFMFCGLLCLGSIALTNSGRWTIHWLN